jgi:hypothetical protein
MQSKIITNSLLFAQSKGFNINMYLPNEKDCDLSYYSDTIKMKIHNCILMNGLTNSYSITNFINDLVIDFSQLNYDNVNLNTNMTYRNFYITHDPLNNTFKLVL